MGDLTLNAGACKHHVCLCRLSPPPVVQVRVADDGGIETTGRLEYKAAGGAQAQSLPNLVSHPKVDPVNGETQNCEVYLVLRRRCSDRRQLRIRLHEMFAPRWGRDPPDQNEATFAKSALCSLLST